MPKSGSTDARGYGWAHQQARAAWRPVVDDGGVGCARCGRPIAPGSPWDLGHTADRRAYTGPEHMRCNRQDGGRRGGWAKRAKRVLRRATELEW